MDDTLIWIDLIHPLNKPIHIAIGSSPDFRPGQLLNDFSATHKITDFWRGNIRRNIHELILLSRGI